MQPIRLFLIRHGNTFEADEVPVFVGARIDPPLTAVGREQALAVAGHLSGEGTAPRVVYCGGLRRQRETAEALSGFFGVETAMIAGHPALTEIDYGVWEGLSTEEISARWPEEYRGWTEAGRWPENIFNGSLAERLLLLSGLLDEIRSRVPGGEAAAAVSSNGVIRLFQTLEGGRWDELAESGRIGELKVATGGFCELELHPRSLVPIRWNVLPKRGAAR